MYDFSITEQGMAEEWRGSVAKFPPDLAVRNLLQITRDGSAVREIWERLCLLQLTRVTAALTETDVTSGLSKDL